MRKKSLHKDYCGCLSYSSSLACGCRRNFGASPYDMSRTGTYDVREHYARDQQPSCLKCHQIRWIPAPGCQAGPSSEAAGWGSSVRDCCYLNVQGVVGGDGKAVWGGATSVGVARHVGAGERHMAKHMEKHRVTAAWVAGYVTGMVGLGHGSDEVGCLD